VIRRALVALSGCTLFSVAAAQELSIPSIDAPPALADFLLMTPSAPVAARFAVISGFTQRTPDDGAASRQHTNVYLAYDARNLYAVFVAFDAEPANVRANLAPRENIEDDDNVGC
jgi:hypothetical protein